MRFLKYGFGLIVATSFGSAFAHDHHEPPPKAATCKAECTKEEAMEGAATKIIPHLIEDGKIDKTWKDLKAVSAEQKQFKTRKEWVVIFKNDKIADKSKQSLYVFVTLDGTLAGVNHSGQ